MITQFRASLLLLAGTLVFSLRTNAQSFSLNELGYFEERGANVLVYNNIYNGGFCDEKLAGIEIIQRGERIATGGGIRLMNTPEQWDIYGEMTKRTVNREERSVEVELTYKDYGFTSRIRVQPKDKGCVLQVFVDEPVPAKLVGKAGMNLEFFPASYFGKNYLVDGAARILPKYPQHDTQVRPVSEKIPQYYGESTFDDRGRGEFLVPLPMSTGRQIVLAPEDGNLRVGITSNREVSIYDGRHLAQNGTFVVRSLLPEGKTGKVLEWYIEPSVDRQWVRKPNIGISQVGYTPAQKKVAVIELDRNDKPATTAQILRINPDGSKSVALTAQVKPWGVFYHRYNYVTVDFSSIREPGLYVIDYAGSVTNAFPIDRDVYSDKWHASMDVSLVVNMDHMEVNEAYRIWHGRANMDDALQAPLNVKLHDGYSMGNTTNTKYKPLERIPGLAVGGWYDAGDFDIQANSVVNTVQDLATLWRLFRPLRDQTFIDEDTKYADIHRPDGTPDVVQQIMHGTLNINAQIENIGFVANVIGQPDMHHYHHLGDAMTLTDGLPYDPSLKPYEVKDGRSGTPDDRMVFTSRGGAGYSMTTIASLAAAYPALKDYFPEEAERSLKNALKLWDEYSDQMTPRNNQRNNRRGNNSDPRFIAAIELWHATGEQRFKDVFMASITKQLIPDTVVGEWYGDHPVSFNLQNVLRVYDQLDASMQKKVHEAVPNFVRNLSSAGSNNPYRVPIQGSNWAGNTQVMSNAFSLYLIWRQFPDLVDPELIFNGLNYIYGCHPYSNVSFITSVGVNTKKVAYSNNRADYTVIPGGVVPGLIVKKPDFFENKDDYPFLWGENECCINSVPNYVMLNLACDEVAKTINK